VRADLVGEDARQGAQIGDLNDVQEGGQRVAPIATKDLSDRVMAESPKLIRQPGVDCIQTCFHGLARRSISEGKAARGTWDDSLDSVERLGAGRDRSPERIEFSEGLLSHGGPQSARPIELAQRSSPLGSTG
jgi:hypothetical protein